MQLAQSFEPQQQTPELILPPEYALDGVEPLFENGGVEDRLAAPLGGFCAAWIRVDVRNHAAIENRFAIYPAIVNAIQAGLPHFSCFLLAGDFVVSIDPYASKINVDAWARRQNYGRGPRWRSLGNFGRRAGDRLLSRMRSAITTEAQ